MPSAISSSPPTLPQWKRPAKTTEALPWADISVIDISTFDEPGGKEKLAEQLRHAVQTTGFFSVTGTGFTEEEVTRQYAIGQEFFNQPLEEKNKPELRCDFGKGNYFGYRAVGSSLR
jgi:isopenicillin N synthase-like dioxygenase